MVRVRLIRKLAACLNGLDVSALRVGDIIELPNSAATMMIAKGWAEPMCEKRLDPLLPPKCNSIRADLTVGAGQHHPATESVRGSAMDDEAPSRPAAFFTSFGATQKIAP